MNRLIRQTSATRWTLLLLLASSLLWVSGCSQNGPRGLSMSGPSAAGTTVTTVYVVRHAEKQSGKDPALTIAGRRRAKALAEMLGDDDIAAVFATQYLRTKQTVEPLALALAMAVQESPAGEPEALAARILRDYAGMAVVAAAHSNTVPRILAALGVAEKIEIADHEYGDLFVVVVLADGAVQFSRHRFGA